MQNFTFHNPTRILFGKGRIADISREIRRVTRTDHIRRRQCRCDRDTGRSENRAQRLHCLRISRHRTKPDLRNADAGSRTCTTRADRFSAGGRRRFGDRRHKIYCCCLALYGRLGDGEQTWPRKCATPFGCVLTLPATGSEMNNGAVVTRRARTTSWYSTALISPRYFQFSIRARHSPCRRPGRQWRSRCIRACHRTISDLSGRRQGAGSLCRRSAADTD